ncbi:hypothetical protein [Neokomagataea anthophila]|uniref:DUF1640 domain-containing protein n=1 Tax=Neokomagataea anthophila TaxID=2826925 RepID=A0ABS5EA43_9PROT|nr:hypothetical protein [Neokomagataea anthophila]MBR0560749.1 hypothetical protein [Neokomagataea anthophila]
MQVSLYQALKDVNISDEKAEKAVKTLEGYITVSIADATAPIMMKLDAMDAANKARFESMDAANKARFDSIENSNKTRFDSIERRFDSFKWTFSAILTVCSIGLAVLNYFVNHH